MHTKMQLYTKTYSHSDMQQTFLCDRALIKLSFQTGLEFIVLFFLAE